MMRPLILTAIAALATVCTACDPDPDANDDKADGDASAECAKVCDRLDECAIEGEDDFDAAACNDGCNGEAADSADFEADVEECSTCIEKEFGFGDDDTCATDFTVCADECANVTFQSN